MADDFLDIARSAPAAIRGDSIPAGHMGYCPSCSHAAKADWDRDDIVAAGSGNIARAKHLNYLAFNRTRSQAKFQEASDAAVRYCAKQRIMGNHESMSIFVYGSHCHVFMAEAVRRVAVAANDSPLADAMAVHVRAEAHLLAACGGQELYADVGRPTVMCGPRSYTRDNDNRIYKMLVESDNPISDVTAWLVDRKPLPPDTDLVRDIDQACHQTFGAHLWDDVPGLDRNHLRALAEWDGPVTPERQAALDAWADAHRASTGVAGTFDLYIFEQGKVGLQEEAYNDGSTDFLHARLYYRQGRPAGWWSHLPYGKDSRIVWLAALEGSRQTEPQPDGHAERAEDGRFRCQLETGEVFDEVMQRYVDGWKYAPAPPGKLCLHVRLRQRTFEVVSILGGSVGPTPRDLLDIAEGLLTEAITTGYPPTKPNLQAIRSHLVEARNMLGVGRAKVLTKKAIKRLSSNIKDYPPAPGRMSLRKTRRIVRRARRKL